MSRTEVLEVPEVETFPVEEIEDLDLSWKIAISKDLKEAAALLTPRQARYLVKTYYEIQGTRTRFGGRLKALEKSENPGEFTQWTFNNLKKMELGLQKCLGHYAAQFRVGSWLQSICGIGPTISAVMLAYYDIRKAKSAAGYWRISGLDPTTQWLGKKKAGEIVSGVVGKSTKVTDEQLLQICTITNVSPIIYRKMISHNPKYKGVLTREIMTATVARPIYDQFLKSFVLGRIGDCFIKVKGNPKDSYGKLYEQNKFELMRKNEAGYFKEDAAKYLQGKVYTGPKSVAAYKLGKLPENQIHRRAIRHMIKIFLSNLYDVSFEDFYGEKPRCPYVFDFCQGHSGMFSPPGWDPAGEGKSLTVMYAVPAATFVKPPELVNDEALEDVPDLDVDYDDDDFSDDSF